MRLRKKVLLAVFVVLAGLISLFHLVLSNVLVKRFEQLEATSLQKDIARAQKALLDEVRQLSTKAKDWSSWDDSFEFIETLDPEYIESNMQLSTLENMGIDDVMFYDVDGTFRYGLRHGLNGGAFEPGIRAELAMAFDARPDLKSFSASNAVHDGFFRLSDGIVMFTAQPILRSSGEGESRGTLVFTKLLTDALVRKIGSDAELMLDLVRLDRLPVPATVDTPPDFSDRLETAQRVVDENTILGFGPIGDMSGKPAFVLRVHEDRDIFTQGRVTLQVLVLCLVSAGLVVSLLIAALLDRLVISRLQNLSEQVTAIGSVRDAGGRVSVEGKDELAVVGRTINTMLSALNETEAQLRCAKEAAEAATSARSHFVANISHELRTPINGILGMSQILLRLPLGTSERQYADMIRKSSVSLLGIINDVLDFSKIDARKLDLEQTEFSLRETLHDALQSIATRAQEKGLEIVLDVDPSVPDTLVGDPLRLRQVILNLAGNSVKFTGEGEVIVGVQRGLRADETSLLHFFVRDTGIGIAADKLDRVFEAFTQADGSTSRQYGGTGLGLTISREIVALMGGTIWVESTLGVGTTFHFTASMVPAQNSARREPMLSGMQFVVVDDCAAFVESVRADVEAAGGRWHSVPQLTDNTMREQSGKTALFLIDAELLAPEEISAWISRLHTAGHRVIVTAPAIRSDLLQLAEREWKVPFVMKPVLNDELFARIAGATADTPATLAAYSGKRLRILVADDVAVNREVLRLMLEPLGHEVFSATNGEEVLEVLRRESQKQTSQGRPPIDILLLDSQMPVMDGYETARRIREQEDLDSSGVIRLPIIAVTANALEGDRERLLEAGLDDYVAKPVFADLLYRKIEQFVPDLDLGDLGAAFEVTQSAPGTATLDMHELLGRFNGKRLLAAEMVELFIEEKEELLDSLRAAVSSGDLNKIRGAAHALKGSLANISAHASAAVASRIEDIARGGAYEPAHLEELLVELETLHTEIGVHFPPGATAPLL